MMFIVPPYHQMPRRHTLVLDRSHPRMAQTPALFPSETVPTQILMGGWGQGLTGRDKKLQGYGISSTAAMEQIQKRGAEMEVKRQLPGGLEGPTKRTREKAPIMHQLLMVK